MSNEKLTPREKIARANYIPYEHGGGRMFYVPLGGDSRELIADFYQADTRDYILEKIGKISSAALSTEAIDVERLRLVLSYADAYTAPFLRQLLRIAEGAKT